MKKKDIVLGTLFISIMNCNPVGLETESLPPKPAISNTVKDSLDWIKQRSSFTILGSIGNRTVRTFSENLLKNGLDQTEFMGWLNFTAAAGQYIDMEISKGSAPEIYRKYILELYQITVLLDFKIKTLQSWGLPNTTITHHLRVKLDKLKKLLREKMKIARNIFLTAYRKIEKETKPSQAWKNKTKNKNSADIFPEIDRFLDEYIQGLDVEQQLSEEVIIPSISDDPVIAYTEAPKYDFRKHTIGNYEKEKNYIADIVEKLHKIIYIEKHKKIDILKRKIGWDMLTGNIRRLAKSRRVLEDIKNNLLYDPKDYMLSDYMQEKIHDSDDKASVILIGESLALFGALGVLKNQITPLIQK